MKMSIAKAKEILTLENNEKDITDMALEIDTIKNAEFKSEIISSLKKTIEKNNLTSLSAPAIGYKARIFCIKFKEEIKTFINPMIVEAKGLQLSKETCSSIPNKQFIIPRNNDITVMYQSPMGKIETRQLVGIAAFVFQHEMHHLDGILLSDIGLEIDDDWDNLTEDEKQEIITMYLDSLDIKSKEIEKEIEEDKDLHELSNAIDFMESVYKGETKLEKIEENKENISSDSTGGN